MVVDQEVREFFGDIEVLKNDINYIKSEIDKRNGKVEKDLDGIFERLRCLEIKFSTFRGQIIVAVAIIQGIGIIIISLI